MPPRRRFSAPALIAAALLITGAVSRPCLAARRVSSPVAYRVSIPTPTSRYVHVAIELAEAPAKLTRVAMPAWAPGSYLIRDFGKHVYEVEAHALAADGRDGEALAVERVDKQTWSVANGGRGFRLRYRVFADELSVRTSYVDDRFALLNGTSVMMYVVGETSRPTTLELEPPPSWPVHTALDPAPGGDGLRPRYVAPSYDELADSPLLLGAADARSFTVAGKPLEFVYLAPAGSNASLDRLTSDAEQIVRSFARTLGGLPFDRYVFLLVGDPVGGGGLEHHDSTAMIVDPWMFEGSRGYARAQRLFAHEFFHLWNVKRIHDRRLGPFDYAHETYSDLLWFHEGLTETMETRALLRAGFVTPQAYVEQLAAAWTSYVRKPGRNHTPIAALSREAWIKAYKPEDNHAATTVSYYEKGNLIGVCLDLSLRLRGHANHTGGSLDGLFRRLWAGRDPESDDAPISIDDIVAAASAEAGEDMRWFFDRYVYGTEELPLVELLEQLGVEVEVEVPSGRAAVWTGMSGHRTVAAVEPGSPAAAAGIMDDDEIVAVDGTRVGSVDEANARIADLAAEPASGARVTLGLFRRERLLLLELTAGSNPHRRFVFARPDAGVDDLERARLRALWLLEHLDGA